jgi:hypothetical protein
MKKLSFLLTSFFAILLTILSSIVPGERTEHYSDILGCVPKCQVVAAGFPIPYIADYPGLSPTHSADLLGAILGTDRFRLDAFCVDVVAYFIFCAALYCFWNGRKASKPRI